MPASYDGQLFYDCIADARHAGQRFFWVEELKHGAELFVGWLGYGALP